MPTITPMNIKPSDELGHVLTNRARGAVMRAAVMSAVEAGDDVVLDFTGVLTMSPSFADELFAKIPRELVDTGRVRFENIPATLTPLLRFVVNGRQPA